jgi:hypothetical protein
LIVAFVHTQLLAVASELGDANPHYGLSIMYRLGHGVEKDEKKRVYIWKRPPLVVMSKQGTISDVMRETMVGWKGQ